MRLIICRYKMKSLSDDSSDSTADLVNDLTTKYLSTLLANERPYFYFLHYMDSHAPYSASPEFADQLSVQHPLPERYSSFANGSLALCKQVLADQIDGIADSRLGFNNLLARYGEELMKVDQSIGEVLDLISASGRPTVILFTSDHGELFGENDSVLHGDNVHAGVIRVPFMLSIPGQKQLRQFAVRPALTDVPLTLLNAAGFKAKSFGSGRNLLSEKAAITALLAVSDQQFSVEQGGFKMMFEWQSAEGNDSDLSPFALYQTSEGVTEEHNLIDNPEYAAQRASLLEEARQILETAVKRDMRAFDDAERVRLSELGYAFDEDGNAVETNH
jgi:arylsulfatase A-like enzyme